MPFNDNPRHTVWSVFEHILRHQLLEACRLYGTPSIGLQDGETDDFVHSLIHDLALGCDYQAVFTIITPSLVVNRKHFAVSLELCNWIFVTERVLSILYQPLLTHLGAEAGHDDREAIGYNITEPAQITRHFPTISQNSNLLRLPNELMDHVLENLHYHDINDLRLTCRQSRMKAFPFWSKKFFKTRQFMIDEYSLKTLLDISRHPELSSVLSHLVIGVDEIDTKDTLSYIRDTYATSPPGLPTVFRYWRDAASAQQALLNTGRAIELLSAAMSNLTNLDTVSVSGSKLFRHAPYRKQITHYPNLGMRSYGSSAYQMQDRYTTTSSPNSKGFVDRVFNCVLKSLVSSSSKITRLRTNLDADDNLEHLDDEAFDLPPFAPLYASGSTVLAGLSELHLDVNLASQLVDQVENIIEHQHTFDPCNFGLRQLLCAACSLECLTLNFYGGDSMESHCDFTAWLCKPAGCEEAIIDTTVYWPNLRRLVLKGLFISPVHLGAIFVKFNTLRSAALRGVFLRRCFLDHPPVPEYSTDGMGNFWASFFRVSSTALENLESLELERLAVVRYREDPHDGVCTTDEDIELITFVCEDSAEPATQSVTVTDFGKDALKKLAEETWFLSHWIAAQDDAEED